MIKSFKHSGLKRYFTKGNPKGIPTEMVERVKNRLNALNRAKELRDMNLPGFGFHALKGDRSGEYAVSVTGNWRIVFKFVGSDAVDVNLEDYH